MAITIGQNLLENLLNAVPVPPTVPDLQLPVLPLTSEIFDLLEQGLAFQNPLAGSLTDCLAVIAGLNALVGASALTPTQQTDMLGALGTGTSSLTGLQTHTNNLVSPSVLPTILGPQTSVMRSRASGVGNLAPLDASNPCTALNEVMGSILGAGGQALQGLANSLNPVAELLGAVIAPAAAVVAAAIGGILGAAALMTQLVANEIAALAQTLQQITNVAFANSLTNFANDPCLQPVLFGAGTPQLKQCLQNNIPDFPEF